MANQVVPVYLITGFLESGKTSFLEYTLQQDYFNEGQRTLLIQCEEGMVEIAPEVLKAHKTELVTVEKEEDFTEDFLEKLVKTYHPERVLIEYNGMWKMDTLYEMHLPRYWELYQVITTVDASTFSLYLANMKPMFMAMVQDADLVIFNRCKETEPLPGYRRSIKAVNRQAQVVFENETGEMEDVPEELPFDLDAPVIEIEDDDFGIWYVDAFDHPENYLGKKISYKGQVLVSREFPSGYFVPGRKAMTCCADDVQFIGFACASKFARKLKNEQWVKITGKFAVENLKLYGGKGPVLYAEFVEPCEAPEEPVIYF